MPLCLAHSAPAPTALPDPLKRPPRVLRYDSATHTPVDPLTPHLKATISLARARSTQPGNRLVIHQTAPWPGDTRAHRIALAAARGLHIVPLPER